MTECASWNPVSINDPTPYYPDYQLPSVVELHAMPISRFNKWREKAKRLWLASWQKRWRYKGLTEEQEKELVKLYREGRKAVFGDKSSHPEDYGCGSDHHKKHWDLTIDWQASWEASKPSWYPPE